MLLTADPSSGDDPAYPDPRQPPWPGFSLAAAAAVQHLDDLVGLDLWLVTALEGSQQTVVAASGAGSRATPPGTSFPWMQSFCQRMVERQGPVVAPDVAQVPAYAAVAVGPLADVRAYVGVPLEGEDGVVFGTLCGFAAQPQDAALAGCLTSVQLVGRMLSTILAREQFARTRSQEAADAYALVERDAVTGLRNRRGWESALEQENTRCQRYGSVASVLTLELDAPSSAEATGDPLARCAEVLTRSCRPGDVLARLGPREFSVLALECDPVSARALLTRLRIALRTAGLAASATAATRRTGEHLHDTWARAGEDLRRGQRRRGRPGAT